MKKSNRKILFLLPALALAGAARGEAGVYEPRLAPDRAALARHLAWRGEVAHDPLPGRDASGGPAGATAQDEAVRAWAAGGATALGWARLWYGEEAGVRQVVRCALERAEQYVESPYTAASAARYCPLNLPLRVPGSRPEAYAWRDGRLPKFGLECRIAVAGVCFGTGTNALDALKAIVRPYRAGRLGLYPAAEARARADDAAGRSYAIAALGVAVHRPCDYAHEFAHAFNPTWPGEAETAEAAAFAAPALNGVASWREFTAAFHALKAHAWSQGIDLGAEGGWAAYWGAVAAGGAAATVASGEGVSADGAALLAAYAEAKAAEGTEADGADYARLRGWCESAAVGRAVL